MRNTDNIAQVSKLNLDYMGFICYPKSPRYIAESSMQAALSHCAESVKRVAVFVNEDVDEVLRISEEFGFDLVQLHGTESPQYASLLKEQGLSIIKAFGIDADFDWNLLAAYEASCSYFLFDTACPNFGGSGRRFDWTSLDAYTGTTEFFLSGGIGVADIETILQLSFDKMIGIDINSRIEINPGLKDVETLQSIIKTLKL